MKASRIHGLSRRAFLARTSGIGAAALLGLPRIAQADPPPETTRIRFAYTASICLVPVFLAEEMLRLEGFSEVEYVKRPPGGLESRMMAEGMADMALDSMNGFLPAVDSGQPIVLLAGIHVGCQELLANERIRAIRDLKGKSIAVSAIGAAEHVFISSILGYVGMDPRKDVEWLTTGSYAESEQRFLEGKADAVLTFPPAAQELRAQKIGRVLLNTAKDRPWSQYYCCLAAANRQFVQQNPVATKRALRALLKAADICANEPERAARYLVEKSYESRYAMALEVLKELPYNRWRESDPEDTVRFYALRLHEVGMIKSSPQKLIAQCTDWRFLNELKRELKA
jgi:NitT/TauT family transport system substrate-binding protein